MDDFLTKPLNVAQLFDRIAVVLQAAPRSD